MPTHRQSAAASSKYFLRQQIPPLALRQFAQAHLADADALEACHLETNLVAHPANLPFAAFDKNEPQLVRVDPFDLCRQERLLVEREAMPQKGQTLVIERARNAHEVFFFNLRAFAGKLSRQPAVLREDDQSLGIDIEPSGRGQPANMFAAKFRPIELVSPIFRRDQFERGLVTLFGLPGDIPDRLIEQYRDERLLLVLRGFSKRDRLVRQNFGAQRVDLLPVDENEPAADVLISLAARADPALRHEFRQSYRRVVTHR